MLLSISIDMVIVFVSVLVRLMFVNVVFDYYMVLCWWVCCGVGVVVMMCLMSVGVGGVIVLYVSYVLRLVVLLSVSSVLCGFVCVYVLVVVCLLVG